MEESSAFGNQILISILGNALTVVLGLLVYIVKVKCKHFQSDCLCPCCRLRSSDQTIRTSPLEPDQELGELSHSSGNSQADPPPVRS